jgi:hypothetical protein
VLIVPNDHDVDLQWPQKVIEKDGNDQLYCCFAVIKIEQETVGQVAEYSKNK